MFFGTVNLQIFILFRVIDVHTFCGFLMTCPVTFQYGDQFLFFIIPDYDIYRRICLCFFCICLHIAPGCDHDGIRIHLFCFVKHLSRLAVGNIGNAAGIDHINVRTRFKRHDFIACRL